MEVVGYSMTKNCADQVFKAAGFQDGEGRDEVGVIELHDCFAANEVNYCLFLFACSLEHRA
jgi:sterol carrier protein 2